MKCPKCKHNTKRRSGMKCEKCGHEFVFDPKADQGINDAKFTAMIQRASKQDTLYFTPNQFVLSSSAKFRLQKRYLVGCVGVFLILYALLAVWVVGMRGLSGKLDFLIPSFIAGVFILAILSSQVPPSPAKLLAWLDKWQRSPMATNKLVTAPQMHDPPPEWKESDIYDYGAERIFIVQHDLLVDLLVRNNVHVRQKALILSETGYPNYLLPVAERMLREHPELPVALLHDADPVGCAMKDRVLQSGILPLNPAQVVDFGMHPDTATRILKLRKMPRHSGVDYNRLDAMEPGLLFLKIPAAAAAGVTLAALLNDSAGGVQLILEMDFG